MRLRLAFLGILLFLAAAQAGAQTPAVPISAADESTGIEPSGAEDVETLLEQAQELFILRRPIDARAKLQKALQLAPKDFRPHMMLGAYYLSEVGHFRLALNYLKTSEQIFREKFGPDQDIAKDPRVWRQHARLLYLLSETRLNLDNYQGALDTLDRFALHYWDDWYPGSRSWILMKLKRVDEAIETAQAGLLRGAEPGRTYNILGILFSLKDNRKLALQAFAQAIRAELALGGSGQVATPLNNAGEVYREMFKDDLAEAAWSKALSMPDGCDHILPSLNLTILYIDALRLFAAERVLNDFEACFAQQSLRSDTEHRALIALARGRIALRLGDPNKAVKQLESATQREQWFGKIGTNQNDLRFAALIDLANALEAKAAALSDRASDRPLAWATSLPRQLFMRLRAGWARRQARDLAIDELGNFEDLYIRHTDAMLEYPTLGRLLATLPARSVQARLDALRKKDDRDQAHSMYQLYLAAANNNHGHYTEAHEILRKIRPSLRPVDRLARAELLAQLLTARRGARSVFGSLTSDELKDDAAARQELFALLPSEFRYSGLRLPVKLALKASGDAGKEQAGLLARELKRRRFEELEDDAAQAQYRLEVTETDKPLFFQLSLKETFTDRVAASVSGPLRPDGKGRADLVNKFISKVFAHRMDPPSEPVAELELLEGIL